ncbi:hypothetical protein ABZW57_30115, partial [Streptomyces pseudogriseolus]
PAPAGGGEDLDDSLAAHGIANHLDRGRDGWEPSRRRVRYGGRSRSRAAGRFSHAHVSHPHFPRSDDA